MAVALSFLAMAIVLIGLTRLVCVLFLVGKPLSNNHSPSSVKTLIVLGSGSEVGALLLKGVSSNVVTFPVFAYTFILAVSAATFIAGGRSTES